MIYIPRVEEPGLLARFGASYREYSRHVPRWIPPHPDTAITQFL
jgi:protein-S-isoprenylcysteine O-methyltransferase Ste14